MRTATAHWDRPPESPSLAPGVVHLWRARLDQRTHGAEVLSRAELARAERFRFDVDRRRWACARTILRMLLGWYLETGPHCVELTAGDHGKPALPARSSDSIENLPRLEFNLSHSGELALYAFAVDNPLGVDIEAGTRPDGGAGAWSILGDEDARRIRALHEPERGYQLTRAWVRTEAALKCLGTGLSGLDDADRNDGLWLVDIDVGGRSAAALAAADAPRWVCRWEWSWHDECRGNRR